jgi:hypothetical protein
MSRTVTRLYRSVKAGGWLEVHESAENQFVPDPEWRPATRRERAWHAATSPRFSWVEFLAILAFIVIADDLLGITRSGPNADEWGTVSIVCLAVFVVIWLWGLWRSGGERP